MTISRPRTEAPRRRPPTPRLGRSGTRGGLAAFLGTGPTAWYDARDLLATTQQTLVNRVGAGSAQLGSTSGSDTNDPAAVPHSGTNYMWFPGTANNCVRALINSPALTYTTSVRVIYDLGPGGIPDNLATATYCPGGLAESSTSGIFIYLTVSAGPTYTLRVFGGDGTNSFSPAVGANIYSLRASIRYIRATWNVGAGSGTAVIEYSADGSSWTNYQTTSALTLTAGTLSTSTYCAAGALPYSISTNPWYGPIYSTTGYLDGAAVTRVNPATDTVGQSSWVDGLSGRTVTVNRSTSGLTTAVVTRPSLMADGTDDYVQLPAGDTPTFTATTGAYTVMVVGYVPAFPPTTANILWSSESSDNVGALLYLVAGGSTLSARVGGSGIIDGFGSYTPGTLVAWAGVYDNGTATAWSSTHGSGSGTSYAALTGVTHNTAPRIGNRANATLNRPWGGSFMASAHWARALTTTELTTAATYLLGTYR